MNKKNAARSRISPVLALIGWLFLLVLPCLLVSISIDMFFENSRKRNAEMIRPQLTNELNLFVEELSVEHWLKTRLQEFDRQAGFVDHSQMKRQDCARKFSSLQAQKVRQKLEDFLGVRIACLFFYGPDTDKAGFDCVDDKLVDVKRIPEILLRRMLGFLNRQNEREALFSKRTADFIKSMIAKNGLKRAQNSVQFLLRTTFGNITSFLPQPFELTKTVSAKLGHTGPAYFYFAPATLTRENSRYNLGGYIAVIREQDVNVRKVIRSAISSGSKGKVRRNVYWSDKRLKFPDHYKTELVTGFVSNESGEYLRAIVPEKLMVNLLQRGTIKVGNIERFHRQIPVIEVFTPSEFLQHPLYAHRKNFKFVLMLAAVFGTALFLRLALYGMNMSMSVSFKILLAVICASLLPVASMVLAYLTDAEFEKNSSRQLIRQYLTLRQSILQKQVYSRISAYERQAIDLAIKLDEVRSFQDLENELKEYLKFGLAQGAYIQKLFNQSVYISSATENSEFKLLPIQLEVQSMLARTFMEFLCQSPYIGMKTSSLARALSDGMSQMDTLNDFLIRSGQIVKIMRASRRHRFCSLSLFETLLNGYSVPSTLLILNYSITQLLEAIFTDLASQVILTESWGEYQIDLAIGFVDETKVEFSDQLVSASLEKEDLRPLVSLCNLLKRDIYHDIDEGDKTGVVMVKYDENLPFVSVLKALKKSKSGNGLIGSEILWPIVYLLIFMPGILIFSKLLFIEPIEEFSNGLRQIASGDLGHRLVLQTGDEFEELSEAFNKMTKGLVEKERLTKYVSDDVIKAVSEDDSQVLKPGGELIRATVLFCEPVGFADFTAENEPALVVRSLNFFLAESSKICAEHHGTIDKIIDNTLMIVFREQKGGQNHVLKACCAALNLAHNFNSQNQNFSFALKCGVSTGQVISGKIGSNTGKLDFTVIGDTVNMAARLKTMAGMADKTGILVSENVAAEIEDCSELREISAIKIKGKSGNHKVFELLNLNEAS